MTDQTTVYELRHRHPSCPGDRTTATPRVTDPDGATTWYLICDHCYAVHKIIEWPPDNDFVRRATTPKTG